MADLLTSLKNITPYINKQTVVSCLWEQLSNLLCTEEATKWDMGKRDEFVFYSQILSANIAAVFTIRDALIRDGVTNLNPGLIVELEEPLQDILAFQDVTSYQDIEELIDRYVDILAKDGGRMPNEHEVHFGGSYFRIFFLTVFSLDLEIVTKGNT